MMWTLGFLASSCHLCVIFEEVHGKFEVVSHAQVMFDVFMIVGWDCFC